mmetsp:Transcript_27935/g.70883  ORF Transcript_27935/g.70883 Transcript_27935/m.70883 type:complete len:659 (+) Transcript_27935:695-2671(+)
MQQHARQGRAELPAHKHCDLLVLLVAAQGLHRLRRPRCVGLGKVLLNGLDRRQEHGQRVAGQRHLGGIACRRLARGPLACGCGGRRGCCGGGRLLRDAEQLEEGQGLGRASNRAGLAACRSGRARGRRRQVGNGAAPGPRAACRVRRLGSPLGLWALFELLLQRDHLLLQLGHLLGEGLVLSLELAEPRLKLVWHDDQPAAARRIGARGCGGRDPLLLRPRLAGVLGHALRGGVCARVAARHLLYPLHLLGRPGLRLQLCGLSPRLLFRPAPRTDLGQLAAVLLAHDVAAHNALRHEHGPLRLVHAIQLHRHPRVLLQTHRRIATPNLPRPLEREHRPVGHEVEEERGVVEIPHQTQVVERPLQAQERDDRDGVTPPALLDQPDAHLVGDVGSELLVLAAGQLVEERELAGSEEDLGDAQLVVLLVEAEGHQQDLAERGRVQRGNGARHHVLVTAVEVVVRAARREPCVHQPESLHHATATQLVEDVAASERVCRLDGVRVDATHKMRRGRLQRVGERGQLRDEVRAHRAEAGRALLAPGLLLLFRGHGLDPLEQLLDEGVAHTAHDALEVRVKAVVVLLQEAVGVVQHLARVVLHDEPLVARQAAAAGHRHQQVRRHGRFVHLEDLLGERLVRALGQTALLVEQSEDADRLPALVER